MIPTLSTLFIPKSVKEYGSGKLDGKLGLELLKTLLLLGLSGSSAGPRILRHQGFEPCSKPFFIANDDGISGVIGGL